MTGKAKSKPFTTFFSGAQTMKILVKDLPDRLAGAVDVEFIVFLSVRLTLAPSLHPHLRPLSVPPHRSRAHVRA